MSISPADVTVVNEYRGRTVTLTHSDFVEIIEASTRELDTAGGERQ